MGDLQTAFADFLSTGSEYTFADIAGDTARYHAYRQQYGYHSDGLFLCALERRLTALPPPSGQNGIMQHQLLKAVAECLREGREMHNAMLCALTACVIKSEK